jgi:lipopolysaccharide transport system ATP-binding protein
VSASIRAEGVGIRFLFDRHQRFVTPAIARLRRGVTEVWGVRGVDLTIEPGRAVALIGPSGAGKTTLLRTIAGVLDPDEGRIAVEGRIGALLSVEAALTPTLTGRENGDLLTALAGFPRRGNDGVLEEIKAHSGLGAAFERPVGSYSQGMYARLGLAAVQRTGPAVLLLDEVHEALDHEYRLVLEELADGIVSGGGIVVAAGQDHELLARFCPEAILFENGSVRMSGPFEDVRRIADA